MIDREIGEFIGVSQSTVGKYRLLSNIGSVSKRRPYKSIDDNWYIIDPYLCYLIGFIFADGYLGKNGLRIHLHKRDIDLLMEFKNRYGGTVRQPRNQQNAVNWWLNRQKLTQCLINNWGMTPGPKSLNMPSVPILDEQLMPHFIRGYFDGDGCIWRSKQGRLGLNIVCGDEQFLVALRDNLPVQYRSKMYECSDGVFSLYTSGKKAKSFLDWMWSDGQGFHLQRKWQGY